MNEIEQGAGALTRAQAIEDLNQKYKTEMGWTDPMLREARQGSLIANPGMQGLKSVQDEYMKAYNMAGRSANMPEDTSYRSSVVYDPNVYKGKGGFRVEDEYGNPLTGGIGADTTGSYYSTLDRYGVDPASYARAIEAAYADPMSVYSRELGHQKNLYLDTANQYRPLYSAQPNAAYTSGLPVDGLDEMSQAERSALLSQTLSDPGSPNVKQFMEATGLPYREAASMLYSPAQYEGMLNWDAINAAENPAVALQSGIGSLYGNEQTADLINDLNNRNYRRFSYESPLSRIFGKRRG